MIAKRFALNAPTLHIPVVDSDDFWYVRVSDENAQIGEFYIAVTAAKPDFYCPMTLHGCEGRTVTLSCADEGAPDDLFDGVLTGGSCETRPDLYPNLYREPERQQIHFSPKRGWLNDPNGLVYAGGAFHMCFQHNPFGPNHGGVNICWGLAVSPDGVHFTEYPDAILPHDSLTHIASGSAIVDEDNLCGLGKDTILAVYTALGSNMKKGRSSSVGTRGQMIEYSTDGGVTFKPLVEGPIIPVPKGESWRDPKILRLDDGTLCIAVYETYDGRNCVSFYSSKNARDWRFESRTMDLYECPDLFPLPVTETGERLWVLYGANSMARIGRFENYRFAQIGESRYLDYGTAAYAGQTWNSHPDETGRYHIAWLRDPAAAWSYDPSFNHGVPFAQGMTVTCRFTLHRCADGYRLFRAPIDALKSLRCGAGEAISLSLKGEPAQGRVSRPAAARIRLDVPGDAEFTVSASSPLRAAVCGQGFDYLPHERLLRFSGGKSYSPAGDGPLSIRIITDRRSTEFFINGEVSASYGCGDAQKTLELYGDDARLDGRLWAMESIWKNNI